MKARWLVGYCITAMYIVVLFGVRYSFNVQFPVECPGNHARGDVRNHVPGLRNRVKQNELLRDLTHSR